MGDENEAVALARRRIEHGWHMCRMPHAAVEDACALLTEVDRLRRDLATRDRELAEARETIGKYKESWDVAARDCVTLQAERDQARAALAEKEREVAEILAMKERDAPIWERLEKVAEGVLTMDEKIREAKLAAAQEEAEGLRAALEPFAERACSLGGDPCCRCEYCIAAHALAARQQQPDDRTYRGDGECLKCAARSGETHSNDCPDGKKEDGRDG